MLYNGTFVKSAFWISSLSFDVGFPSLIVGLLLVEVKGLLAGSITLVENVGNLNEEYSLQKIYRC